jgi:hypothetical protein
MRENYVKLNIRKKIRIVMKASLMYHIKNSLSLTVFMTFVVGMAATMV